MSEEKIISYKGFGENLKCHGGFQYELGKEYEQDGEIKACHNGFHACERPLDVFNHFSPAESRFCVVEQSGDTDRDNDDSKVASRKIKIVEEIGIPGLVKAQIAYVKAHTTSDYTDPKQATAGYRGAATAGYSGAATAGDRGAATAGDSGAATAGYRGAATAGYSGAATAGDRGAATAGDSGAATAGYRGAATAGDSGAATAGDRGAATAGYRGFALSGGSASAGENGIAVAHGEKPKAKGRVGAVLVLAQTDDAGNPICVKSAVVDGEKVKPDAWYTLKNGRLTIWNGVK